MNAEQKGRPSNAFANSLGSDRFACGTDLSDLQSSKAISYLVHHKKKMAHGASRISPVRAPRRVYLKYHLYRNSFPVYALARYSNQSRSAEEYVALKSSPANSGCAAGF